MNPTWVATAARLLRGSGHAKVQVLGYPLTVHFYSHNGMPRPTSIGCEVWRQAERVQGVLHIASGGTVRRSSAPGLVAFYPLKPLERGTESLNVGAAVAILLAAFRGGAT